MKFISKRLSLYLIALSTLVISTYSIENFLANKIQVSLHSEARMTNNTNATTASNVTTAASAAKAATNTTGEVNSSSNVTNSRVTTAPYTVTSCDQIVELSANTLLDENDFSKKGPSFFTISIYMINQFSKRDGNTLLNSVSFDKIVNAPKLIDGSVSCLRFTDSSFKKINMCMPDKTTAESVLKSFAQFEKCRLGDNLKNIPEETVKNVIKGSCLGLDVKLDIEKFGGDVNKAKTALSDAMNNAVQNVVNTPKDSKK